MVSAKKNEFDAICLILDVGRTSVASGFLKRAIECAAQLIERKLFSESQDHFGLVLSGTPKTANGLGYSHITVVDRPPFGPATFDLHEFVCKHVSIEEEAASEADWLDAVVVALDYLKEQTESGSCKNKKIVLLSDLGSKINDENLDTIIHGMETENVEFTHFGPDLDDPTDPQPGSSGAPNRKPKSQIQIENEKLIEQMTERTDGIMCTIDEAMIHLLFIERKAKKPFPWKVCLEIGPDIKIATTGYLRIRREPSKSWKKCLARAKEDDDFELKSEVSYVLKKEDDDDDKDPIKVDQDNLIESYNYGSKLITVTDEDKDNFKYYGGPKSLILIGFIQKDQIPYQYLMGDGCMVFGPTEDDEHSTMALSAMASAMVELGRAALVRRVYRSGSAPRLGVLIPEVEEVTDTDEPSNIRLVYIELPFQEDVRRYYFAPLYNDSVRPNETQLDAIDRFIDASMLNEDDFDSQKVMNPLNQYLYRSLAHRASNPGQILPNVSDFIKKLVKAPDCVINNNKDILEEIKSIFPREIITLKKRDRKRKWSDENNDNVVPDDDSSSNTVTTISIETPVSDLNKLLDQGESLVSVAQQLEKVILTLLRSSFGSEVYGKIIRCLKAYREACLIKSKPQLYNDFLRLFKSQYGKENIWLDVIEGGLGLISKFEHGLSTVSTSEADVFLTDENV